MSNIKVGKRTRNGVYVQYRAIEKGESNLTEREMDLVRKAIINRPDNFTFDFVWTDGRGKVRLMKMNDLKDPHPHVETSLIYDALTKTYKKGQSKGQIYHRLETMMSPSDPTYYFHRMVTYLETQMGLLNPPVPGFPKQWKKKIEDSGISYDEYLQRIESLR